MFGTDYLYSDEAAQREEMTRVTTPGISDRPAMRQSPAILTRALADNAPLSRVLAIAHLCDSGL